MAQYNQFQSLEMAVVRQFDLLVTGQELVLSFA